MSHFGTWHYCTGVIFTMPQLEDRGKKETGSESQDDDSDEEEEREPGDGSDDEHSDKREWLESMGLDKEQFPLLNPKTVTPHQRNNLRTIDQQPTSTVLVKGADTHALFNFLLNCKSLTANTGPQAQVPPTLLAPVAFDGATLKSLRVNQGILKHQQAKGMKQVNGCDQFPISRFPSMRKKWVGRMKFLNGTIGQ